MPELPEVQTIVKELQSLLPGKKLTSLNELYDGTIRFNSVYSRNRKSSIPEEDFLGKILSVSRRGKYIVISLTGNNSLIIHLRMTGKLIYNSGNEHPAVDHVRAILTFSDNSSLLFNDPRTFGKIDVITSGEVEDVFCKLGCEPLTNELNCRFLVGRFSKSKMTIKKALLDQSIIAGIGNIYANEILYQSKLMPFRSVNTLSQKEIEALIRVTKSILKKAISCNGTTISDYRRIDDKQGSFQNYLKVYGKTTCPKSHQIIRDKSDGRSTYYCPVCQK